MHTFALDGRFSDTSRFAVARQIRDALTVGGMRLDEAHPDIVICLGGDGSLLKSCNSRGYVGDFILLNGGTLGYLSEFKLSEWEKAVQAILHSQPSYEVHRPLVVEDRLGHHAFAANDVSLIAPVRAINYEIFADGEKLAQVHGSGLVAATALGSTAFSMSIGGPVLLTGDEVFSLTLAAPIRNRLTQPPFENCVLKSSTLIKIKLEQNSRLYRIAVDGIDSPQINGHELFIYMSKTKQFRLLHYHEKSKIKRVYQSFSLN